MQMQSRCVVPNILLHQPRKPDSRFFFVAPRIIPVLPSAPKKYASPETPRIAIDCVHYQKKKKHVCLLEKLDIQPDGTHKQVDAVQPVSCHGRRQRL